MFNNSSFIFVPGDYVWTYIRKGALSFEHYNPIKKVVKVEKESWAFGLGMHNFRALLRDVPIVVKDKSSSHKKDPKMTKRCGKCGSSAELRSLFRKEGFNPKFRKQDQSIVKKAGKTMIFNNDEKITYESWCKSLRKVSVRRSSQYRRHLASQRRKFLTLCSEKMMAKLERSNMVRNSRRRKWFFDKSFKKLPTMVVAMIVNGFSKYCSLVSKVGCGFAFWLFNNWKTKELRQMRLKMEELEKKKIEAERAKFGLAFYQNAGPSQVPKPMRTSFPNFKSWATAVGRWQVSTNSCRDCYSGVYNREYDEDKNMWKGTKNYTTLSYKDCEVCGKKQSK